MRRKSRLFFYENCSSLLSGGISLVDVFDKLKEKLSKKNDVIFFSEVRSKIQAGEELNRALRCFPSHERELVRIGEMAGELIGVLDFLVKKIKSEIDLEHFIILRLWQPFFLFLCALFLFPTLEYFLGESTWFGLVGSSFFPLLIVMIIIGLILWRWYTDDSFRVIVLNRLLIVPYLKETILIFEAYKMLLVYEMLVRAGMENGIIFGFLEKIIFTPLRKKAIVGAIDAHQKGENPVTILASTLDKEQAARWSLAMDAGREEEMIHILQLELKKSFDRRIDLIAKIIPKLIYILVALLVAYELFSFFALMLGEIEAKTYF